MAVLVLSCTHKSAMSCVRLVFLFAQLGIDSIRIFVETNYFQRRVFVICSKNWGNHFEVDCFFFQRCWAQNESLFSVRKGHHTKGVGLRVLWTEPLFLEIASSQILLLIRIYSLKAGCSFSVMVSWTTTVATNSTAPLLRASSTLTKLWLLGSARANNR